MNDTWNGIQRILVVTAVEAEKDAILRGIGRSDRFDVIAAGVGPAAAAAGTAAALASSGYRLVISAGIGGGFNGQADIGSIVVASEIISADLGAETPDGFIGVDELGFGTARLPVPAHLAGLAAKAIRAKGAAVGFGPALTVSTATGTAETAARLAARFPGAASEAMEGYGAAIAAAAVKVPVLEIRAISNAVGPRDRKAWRIKEALERLETAGSALLEVLCNEDSLLSLSE